MKKLLMIGIAILVLASGGFAAWQFLNGGAEDETESASAPAASELAFIKMDPFIIAVIGDDKVVKHISVTLKLEVMGAKALEKAQESMPLLRDALFTRLHASLSRARPEDQPYDLGKLKARLLATCEKVVGPGVVREVLVEELAEKAEP